MTQMAKLVLAAILGLAIFSTVASADINNGKKIYMKKLRDACGFTGAKFARVHTQDEWEMIKEAGKFGEEIKKICPKSQIEPKYENDLYDFSYEFAKDSGKVPSC